MDGFSGGYAYFFPMDRVMVRQELSFSKKYELLIKYIYLINHSIFIPFQQHPMMLYFFL